MKNKIRFFFQQVTLLLVISVCHLPYVGAQCTEDCVWPGDLNANGVANSLDVLALGLAWGSTGPPRANMSTDWEPLDADDWAGSLPVLGSNFKHCDADGDGILEVNELFVINLNYYKTNPNFTGTLGNEIPGNDLFIVPQNTSVSPGGSLFFDIHLGTADNPINDLYGIAFELAMDTQYVEEVLYDFSDNWIGPLSEALQYGKYSEEYDHTGMAISRIDGNTVNGFGKIASVEIVIVDVILAIENDTTTCVPFPVSFENVLGINADETDLLITAQSDTAQVKHDSQLTGINVHSPDASTGILLFPNPAKEVLYIRWQTHPVQSVAWYNQLGQAVFREALPDGLAANENHPLSIPELPAGIYFIACHGKTTIVKKIQLE